MQKRKLCHIKRLRSFLAGPRLVTLTVRLVNPMTCHDERAADRCEKKQHSNDVECLQVNDTTPQFRPFLIIKSINSATSLVARDVTI